MSPPRWDTSGLIVRSGVAQQKGMDEVFRRFSNYIRGAEDVRDPVTGREFKVESGANYYWIDALGRIVGTEIDENPDALRFERLIQVP